MNGEFVAFFILSLSAIIGGVLMLNLTKVMHMMLALVLTFLSIAGLYFLLSAEFIGVAQILLYSGAITIIMIFGIMLTKHNAENESRLTLRKWIIFFAVVAFGAVMYFAVNSIDFSNQSTTQGSLPLHENNTLQIGTLLYSKYIIPFELTSVILLVALVGAIILAKKDEKEEDSNE
ncbi:NADH-quinone oxidoreductase subunit J [Bacillus cereus]|uniref:NADH-quinone oxidoreductase subunit J n=3 Tax=Bacteria TaxID=2 RepID=A0A7V7SBT3_9BACI|nr:MULTISPECIES: NADH-quinone oxidoreductase subunit J [Bacillus cereus group]KAA0764884.1 NADH-quinone oxidoreductase subunit J [Bacillus sp. SH5-2]KAB2445552.1 NADH-quinone oxidoreductase subunit J [Bacillus luti]OJE50433.1 NADH:ubiquinone oxidoreductase subunit J [Bacillus luti]RGN79183.1 NADH-quinone oxidoreductase subunit J [Bacillus cereus]